MALIDIFVFAAGFVAAWYGKDKIQKWWQGAAAFASNLESKASSVRAAVETVKAAATAPAAQPPANTGNTK
jgi:hypothetical protein